MDLWLFPLTGLLCTGFSLRQQNGFVAVRGVISPNTVYSLNCTKILQRSCFGGLEGRITASTPDQGTVATTLQKKKYHMVCASLRMISPFHSWFEHRGGTCAPLSIAGGLSRLRASLGFMTDEEVTWTRAAISRPRLSWLITALIMGIEDLGLS